MPRKIPPRSARCSKAWRASSADEQTSNAGTLSLASGMRGLHRASIELKLKLRQRRGGGALKKKNPPGIAPGGLTSSAPLLGRYIRGYAHCRDNGRGVAADSDVFMKSLQPPSPHRCRSRTALWAAKAVPDSL